MEMLLTQQMVITKDQYDLLLQYTNYYSQMIFFKRDNRNGVLVKSTLGFYNSMIIKSLEKIEEKFGNELAEYITDVIDKHVVEDEVSSQQALSKALEEMEIEVD